MVGRRFSDSGSGSETWDSAVVSTAIAFSNSGALSIAGFSGIAGAGATLEARTGGFVSTAGPTAGATGACASLTTTGGATEIALADSDLVGSALAGSDFVDSTFVSSTLAGGTFIGSAAKEGFGGGAGGASLVAAARADSAKRSSSSGLRAPSTSSASRVRLRTSLSLKAKGHSENASSKPITRRRPQSGTATIERAPSLRQASRFTRGSVSVSSQMTISAARKQAPENAESRSMRAPTSGRTLPAAARNTISLFSASAMARPSAPVMATARSATS